MRFLTSFMVLVSFKIGNAEPLQLRRRDLQALVETRFSRDIEDDDPNKLGRCVGDCDTDDHCAGDLVCFERDAGDPAPPGCVWSNGRTRDDSNTDFCVRPEDVDASLTMTDKPTAMPAAMPTAMPTASGCCSSSDCLAHRRCCFIRMASGCSN